MTDDRSKEENRLRQQMWACKVPGHLHDGLIRYIVHGVEPGGCLFAVLSNDLMEAFGRADEETALGMKGLCTFIYSYAPNPCHGSKGKVEAWIASMAEARRLAKP